MSTGKLSFGAPRKEPKCRTCDDGGILSIVVDGSRNAIAARCMCAAGQTKSSRIQAIDALLTPEALARYYPDGLPAEVDTVGGRLKAFGVPARAAAWNLDSYAAHFKGFDIAIKYAAYVPLWASRPLADRSDIVLVGSHGVGKSGLSVCMARECAKQGERVKWWYVPELLTAYKATFNPDGEATEAEFQQRLIDVDLLVLDELAGASITDFVQTTLTTVIHLRQQAMRPTVMTLNMTATGGKVDSNILAQMLGPALTDRVAEHAELWPLFGESLRPTYRRKP